MQKVRSFFTKERVAFMIVFAVLGLIALNIPFTNIAGSKVKFTLFDFIGPVATAFIGTVPGIIAVFLMQFSNFVIHGAEVVDAGTIIRFFPMLFGALYFAKKRRATLLVPLAAIIAFNVDPVGRSVWYYSLYWLIPVACYFLYDRFLLARSLGATFTAHAVGGALWVHFFNLPAAVWIGLIPVVAMERFLFAVGITVAYLAVNNVLYALVKREVFPWKSLVNEKYVWRLKRESV